MKRFGIFLLSALVLLFPLHSLAQAQSSGPDPWARVRYLVGEGKVDVTTKAGLKLRGTLVRFEWNEIVLRPRKGADQKLTREEVQEIRTVSSRGKIIGLGIAGALAGAALGAAVGGGTAGVKEVPKSESGKYIGAGIGIGAVIGAIGGAISGRNRTAPSHVVYTAPPATQTP